MINQEFNLQKSLGLWQKWVLWHQKKRPDLLRYDQIKGFLAATNFVEVMGRDRQNYPVIYLRGQFSTRFTKLEDLENLIIFVCEYTIRKAELLDKQKISILFDFTGFTLAMNTSFTRSATKYIVEILQDFYAERNYKIYLTGLSLIFRIIFNIVKQFFSKKTMADIIMVSDFAELAQYIEKSQTPKWLSGELETPAWDVMFAPLEQIHRSMGQGPQPNQDNPAQQIQSEFDDEAYFTISNNSEQFFKSQVNTSYNSLEPNYAKPSGNCMCGCQPTCSCVIF